MRSRLHRISLFAVLACAVTSLLPSPSSATSAGRPDQPGGAAGSRDTEPSVRWETDGDGVVYVTTTRDRRILAGTDNQGWWSDIEENRNRNDNYATGRCCGGGRYRAFFTFDLSRLAGTPVAAALEVRRYSGRSSTGSLTLALFDVRTPAEVLNHNVGIDLGVFKDLGSGTRYGEYAVSTTGPEAETVRFKLNRNALADIAAARGGYFSIGGALLNGWGYLFGYSSGLGVQRLVVHVACDVPGSSKDDVLAGTDGPDYLCGYAGDDELSGGDGPDVVEAGDGDDVVLAGAGSDTVDLGPGSDHVRAGAGDDVIRSDDGAPGDVTHAGPGYDVCYVDPGDSSGGCESVHIIVAA